MKKQELRISNLIHNVLLGTSMVLELRNDGISICNPIDHRNAYFIPNKELHQLEPLFLTEKYLRDFGFKSTYSTDPQNCPASKCFNLNGFKIHQPIDDVDQFIFEPIVDECIKLHSVHQIQNLYFSIMSDELVINSNKL